MTSPAETLRAAAAKLRRGVEHCAPEPHNYTARNSGVVAVLRPELSTALASWLEKAANDLELNLPHWGPYPGGIDDPPIHRTPEDTALIVEHHFGAALAVARVLLGEDQDTSGSEES